MESVWFSPTAALCSCQNLLFATVGVSLLSYREKQTHRVPNCCCILYNKDNPPQSSRPSNDQSTREFLKADFHWFGTNVNIYVNVLPVCWVQGRSCDSKDFLSDREYIQNPPPRALTCTCRHSVGYCLMRMRISLYQGKHWCSSAIVLIVPPRSIIPVWLSFIHLCDWVCVRACVCAGWVFTGALARGQLFPYLHSNMQTSWPLSSRCIKLPLKC